MGRRGRPDQAATDRADSEIVGENEDDEEAPEVQASVAFLGGGIPQQTSKTE